ncbi:hypothetical protein B296_00047775 [Ensete ventricosum]|uniref:Uncharacterized protein n=1 Tax=Ensete ventricosum TaxID=4639 RepID=A0A426XIZ4_ENSVE|nr:hypothetical protein B296_00047775 [Ensete ventricosum]
MGCRTSTISRKNMTVINVVESHVQSRVLINFSRTVSEFQNIGIPNVLAHGKSYEYDFMKKCDGHKLCAKSSFDRFFTHYFRISKYWQFAMY